MKRFLLLNILIILSACSSTGPTPRTLESNYREVSSLLESCSNLVSQIFKRNPVGKLTNAEVSTFSEFKKIFTDPEPLQRKLTTQDLETIVGLRFIVELEIGSELSKRLTPLLNKKIIAIPIDNLIEEVLKKKMANIVAIDEIEKISKKFIERELPDDIGSNVLKSSPTVEHIYFNRTITLELGANFKEQFVNVSKNLAKSIYFSNDFFKLLDRFKNVRIDQNSVIKIIETCPYFKKLENDNPGLAKTLRKSFNENFSFGSDYLLDNLSIAVRVLLEKNHKDFKRILSHINSSYSFFNAMNRIILDDNDYPNSFDILATSPFCKKMGISAAELVTVFERSHTEKADLATIMKEVFPIYKNKKSFETVDFYDAELNVVQVKDQCDWGSCWVHTGLEYLEAIINYHQSVEIPLSSDYIYMKYMSNQYKLAIFGEEITPGGYQTQFDEYVKYWGIMPQNIWKPKINFHSPDGKKKIEDAIFRLNENLKKAIAANPDNIENLQMDAIKKIDEIFEELFGKIPEIFIYRGKTYNAKTFLEHVHPDLDIDARIIQSENYSLKKEFELEEVTIVEQGSKSKKKKNQNVSLESVDKMLERIIEQIDIGLPVKVDTIWPKDQQFTLPGSETPISYVNKLTGALNSPQPIKPVTLNAGHHAILVVGYELDKNGKVAALKILNSWGKHSGDKGFYHMNRDFIHAFLVRMYE